MEIKKWESLSYKCYLKFLVIICVGLFLCYSCKNKSALKEEFNCKEIYFTDLETFKDAQKEFAISLPSSWKTTVYKDAFQSSIYTADTTKELTKTILLDINYIKTNIEINDLFKLKIEQSNLSEGLIQKISKKSLFLDKPSYYVVSVGKKGKYQYKSLQLFLQINNKTSLVVKAEVYGNSLVAERLCSAITLIDKIKLL